MMTQIRRYAAVVPILSTLAMPVVNAADENSPEPVSVPDAAAAPVSAEPPSAPADTNSRYIVQPGDVLHISVWKEQDLQSEVLVGPDGGFSFPLAGELTGAGKTLAELRGEIAQRIKRFVPDAVVTVALKQSQGNRIYVVGKVNRPGDYAANREIDVMQALSLAGGTTQFASVNKITVLRRSTEGQRSIPFRYKDIEKGRNLEQNIVLRGGDIVVVP